MRSNTHILIMFANDPVSSSFEPYVRFINICLSFIQQHCVWLSMNEYLPIIKYLNIIFVWNSEYWSDFSYINRVIVITFNRNFLNSLAKMYLEKLSHKNNWSSFLTTSTTHFSDNAKIKCIRQMQSWNIASSYLRVKPRSKTTMVNKNTLILLFIYHTVALFYQNFSKKKRRPKTDCKCGLV